MKIYGLYWYYCLIPKEKTKGLFSDYPRSTLMNKFLICWDYQDKEKKRKLYHCFDSFLDFVIFYFKIPDYERCFYEIILGEFPQKIHFDLDFDCGKNMDEQKIINELVNVIISLIPEIKIEKDICLYSSHGNHEGRIKRSYHLVVNHFCHKNNEDSKSFYYKVMSELPKEYFEKQFIDSSVYSKTQQFRTLGSKKIGTNRIKILEEIWEFNGKKIQHVYDETYDDEETKFLIQFEESVVKARLSNSKLLPSFDKPKEFEKKNYEKSEDIDYDIAIEAINLLASAIGIETSHPKFPFKFDKIEGPFVILKRIKPSKCRLCKRIHEHQNPYLFITPKEKYVFYHCRRAPSNKKMFIGSLEIQEDIPYEKLEIVISNKQDETKTDIEEISWLEKTRKKLEKIAKTETKITKTKVDKKIKNEHIEQMINYSCNN